MFHHKHVHGMKIQRRRQPDQTTQDQESPRPCPICTSSSCAVAGGVIGIGLRFCGSRQLSSIPTCCTHETVHRGAQNFLVEYSRCRISGVYCDNGIPGYPRCCEHQCTRPSSQIYRYREPERHRQLCSLPRATLCWNSLNREKERFPSAMTSSKISCSCGPSGFNCPLLS